MLSRIRTATLTYDTIKSRTWSYEGDLVPYAVYIAWDCDRCHVSHIIMLHVRVASIRSGKVYEEELHDSTKFRPGFSTMETTDKHKI